MAEIEYTRFNLRIPTDLFEEIKNTSENKSRSMNAEIIDRLRRPPPITGVDDAAALLSDREKDMLLAVAQAIAGTRK